jgi:DNA polymerase III gamma/tau subunit
MIEDPPEAQKAAPRNVAPRRFEEVIGRRNAVDSLRTWVQSRDVRGGVILYGPEGVGKRTLARLFAKAVLCERPEQFGSPCNSCDSCRHFDERSSMGYAEFDPSTFQSEHTVRDFLDELRRGSFADRDVVVVRNADLCELRRIDAFLQTLEELQTEATFILLVDELKRMRLAVQSRCKQLRLRPLQTDEIAQLCRELAEAKGVQVDEPVLDLLAVASRGLPGQLLDLINQLVDEPMTLSAVRRKLELDWGDDMVAYWSAILSGDEPPECLRNLIAGPSSDESLRRLRVFLNHFYLHELRQPPVDVAVDAALMHLDEGAWRALGARFNEYARMAGMIPDELWRVLARCSLSGDHFDALRALAAGLDERSRRSRMARLGHEFPGGVTYG